MPSKWLELVNKPKRHRILADFGGYHSELTALSVTRDGNTVGVGFADGSVQMIEPHTGRLVRNVVVCDTMGTTSTAHLRSQHLSYRFVS